MGETTGTRTVYMTFRGYCMHCGNPTGESIHQDDTCNMEGAELRLDLLGMAFGEFLNVERAERVIEAAQQYAEWQDEENKEQLRSAIAAYREGPGE